MELQLKESTVQVCQDLARLTKSAQITMESVVPDTKDDIGRILSVRPEIYLKSKEIRSRSATVGGEAVLSVLYINEAETAVSYFSLSQSFVLEYELPLAEENDLVQLQLSISNLQSRVLNPRKVSVDLEILGELTASREGSFVISQTLQDDAWPVHLQTEESDVSLLAAVCEKSFSVNEQLQFPDDAPKPRELISKETVYRVAEREAVGSRLLVKGEAVLQLNYLAEDSELPQRRMLRFPFSQLIDLGACEAESAEVWVTPTSDYINLIDAIDGRKLLDLELHALAQVRARKNQRICYVTDAYSNLMPSSCDSSEELLTEKTAECRIELSAQETIELPEEFQELLAVYPTLGSATAAQGSLSLDLLCRSTDGKLFPMRRNLTLTPAMDYGELSMSACLLSECSCRQEDRRLLVQIRAEGEGEALQKMQSRRIVSIQLDEERAFRTADFPTLTAVWAETESVWELAKLYHSSPEAIRSMNGDCTGNPIFIPKTK